MAFLENFGIEVVVMVLKTDFSPQWVSVKSHRFAAAGINRLFRRLDATPPSGF
jgi:hypothetical protein